MFSQTEENYLKAIFTISANNNSLASTNAISKKMSTSAASVTDMLKRLADKDLIHYEKYKGVSLTKKGQSIATDLVRKHRLWEVFLVEKLGFAWDEVHEIAEELEHIQSPVLVERLDSFLNFPKFDPHGDPIPDAAGIFTFRPQILLTELVEKETGVVVGVKEHSPTFLQYLDRLQIQLGAEVNIIERFEYDGSIKMLLMGGQQQIVSHKVCQNIYVQKL